MKRSSCEIFKLDEVDREVFFWLINHVQLKATASWIDFIVTDYKHRKRRILSAKRLYEEAKEIYELSVKE